MKLFCLGRESIPILAVEICSAKHRHLVLALSR
jgi:hypothetical protein